MSPLNIKQGIMKDKKLKNYKNNDAKGGVDNLPQAPNKEELLDTENVFKLLDLYFKQKNIMYSHLHNSFDKFLDEDVKSLLKNTKNVFFEKITKDKVYKYMFEFDNISIKPPTDNDDEIMFPNDARTRNMTYASKLVATITQVQEVVNIANGEVTRKQIGFPEYDFPIAIIPIMVRSKYCSLNIKKGHDKNECEYDPGGYFIINGSEKVVMSLERMVDNKPLVFTKKDSNSLIYTVQVNSKSYSDNEMTQIVSIRMKKDKLLFIRVPILNEIPVFILFRALGVESDKSIINMIAYDKNDMDMINLIRLSLENATTDDTNIKIRTEEDAIKYLINKMRVVKRYSDTDGEVRLMERKQHLDSLLKNNFLPHIEHDKIKKAYYLGYMINRLLQVFLGRIPKDDRDSYVNKRIDLPGTLIFELFKQYYKKMLNECSKFFKRRNNDDENPLPIINQIKPNIIEQGLKGALSTGVWGKRKGVAQMLQRLTYLQTISSLRKINSPTVDASTNKLTSPRHLHNTQLIGVCVTGDTEILLGDGTTLKRIDELKPTDTVMTVNKNDLTLEPSKIYNYFKKMPDKLLKITTHNKKILKCTEDHPLLIKRVNGKCEMVKAGMLNDNNIVTMYNFLGNNVMVMKIEKIEEIEPELVYDFTTVSDNHSFIGNSFIMSNCYVQTPEGHKVGLVKHLSLTGNITLTRKSQVTIIKSYLEDKIQDIHDISAEDLGKLTKVFLNGEWLGLTDNPRKLYLDLRRMKLNGDLHNNTSIVHEIKSEIESKEIKIFCDGGRLYRPFLIVNNNTVELKKSNIDTIVIKGKSSATTSSNWNEFMIKNRGTIEYLDADEYVNSMIAMFPTDVENNRKKQVDSAKMISKIKLENNNSIINRYDNFVFVNYTHCEIHPSMMIGEVVASIPFCNHNQGPRNIYQYSQAKQAMGIYASNYRERLDISYILYNPQKALVSTKLMKYVNIDRLPAGENLVVAIACYSGYNQEDSVIVNKSAVDRGMFRAKYLKKYITTIQKNQSTSADDVFEKPDKSKVAGMKQASYDKLNDKGYVPEETRIENGDIIMAKISPIQPIGNSNKTFKDNSEAFKSHVPGRVDRVWTGIYNHEGYEMRKMRIRSERIPIIGDKMCSRAGQKGTVGILLPAADMPFTKEGIQPGLIVNSNAIPSRMTIGQLIECLVGKKSALKGHESDGTPFNYPDIESIKDELEELGYNRNGTEYLYNGMTGKKMRTEIFIGPTYYQRLKHMVSDKIHCLTMDHEVLTENGWKFYDQLTEEDKVATLRNNKLAYEKPNKLLYFSNYDGKLYNIKTQQIDLSVTDNHRMYVSEFADNKGIWSDYEMHEAKDIFGKRVKYKKDAEWDVSDYKFESTSQSFDMNNWLKFYGYWMTNKMQSIKSININKEQLSEYLSILNKYYSKEYLSNWVWKLSKKQCRILIKHMLCQDNEANNNYYNTKSNKLADDFMRLCLHAGWSCNKKNINEIWKLNINYSYDDNNSIIDKNTQADNITEEMVEYSGPVFCLEMPTEIFYVRRNGKPVWTCNSRARGPRTLLTRQAPEGRSRDGGLRFGEMERDCIISHGMALFLKERMVETADGYSTYLCMECGFFATRMLRKDMRARPTKKDIYHCQACRNYTKIAKIRIPYAFKLLVQEMMSMNIAPRIRVKESKYND